MTLWACCFESFILLTPGEDILSRCVKQWALQGRKCWTAGVEKAALGSVTQRVQLSPGGIKEKQNASQALSESHPLLSFLTFYFYVLIVYVWHVHESENTCRGTEDNLLRVSPSTLLRQGPVICFYHTVYSRLASPWGFWLFFCLCSRLQLLIIDAPHSIPIFMKAKLRLLGYQACVQVHLPVGPSCQPSTRSIK